MNEQTGETREMSLLTSMESHTIPSTTAPLESSSTKRRGSTSTTRNSRTLVEKEKLQRWQHQLELVARGLKLLDTAPDELDIVEKVLEDLYYTL